MNNSSTICIDANILLRLAIKPEDEDIQRLWDSWILQAYQLVAPTLLYYEIANGIYQQQKNRLLSPAFVRDVLDFLLNLPIRLIGDATLHRRACELAAAYRLPAAYDAHYLALAERLSIEFWTTDARLVNALQPFGLAWVRLAAEAPAGS